MPYTVYKKLETSSNVNELSKIRDFVAHECSSSFDKDSIMELLTVINEAVSNIMRHAYEGQIDGSIVTELTMYDNKIKLVFTDWGKEFEPDKIPPPIFDGTREGGYGWYIINNYTDEVHYCRNGDRKNILILIKEFKKKK